MHDHSHGHNHGHDGGDRFEQLSRNKKKLRLVLVIILGFAGVEVVGGLLSNSLALLSDAGHMVVDGGAIALSLFAAHISLKPATPDKTYSLVRVEIVAAFVNGLFLFALAGFILYEAFERFQDPPEIRAGMMLTVAFIGMLVNVVAAWILWGASHHSLNIKGALLHVLGDLAGSVGAVIAALVVIYTGFTMADPIVSLMIALLIVRSSVGLMKESLHILLEGAPQEYDADEIAARIESVEGVEDVHDFHLWLLTTGMPLLTAHVQIGRNGQSAEVLNRINLLLHKEYGLTHTTIQIEEPAANDCGVGC